MAIPFLLSKFYHKHYNKVSFILLYHYRKIAFLNQNDFFYDEGTSQSEFGAL